MRSQGGITLLELIIAVSLLAILASAGVPAMHHFYQKQRADALEAKLLRTFQSARQHAVKIQRTLHMCGSNDGTRCAREWSEYALIYHDANKDLAPSPGEIIEVQAFGITDGKIKSRIGLNRNAVTLTPKGTSVISGSFIYCPNDETTTLYRRLTWNRIGRPYLGLDRDGDGYVDDTDGSPLTCG